MTRTQIGALMRRARKLANKRIITASQFRLIDALVFQFRAEGSDGCSASYTRIAGFTKLARETVRLGIARLEALGLLRKQKHWVRVPWGGSIARRQGTNSYTFIAPATEPNQQAAYRVLVDSSSCTPVREASPGNSAIQQALDRLGAAIRSASPLGA